jgi:putative ABC transport system permease protein
VRSALVVAELALSLVLLVGAGLFIQSLSRLLNVDVGYDSSNVLTLEYRLPQNKYQTAAAQVEFHEQVLARLQALPGVRSVAFARAIPQSGNGSIVGFWREGDPQPTRESMPRAQFNVVSPDYFATLGIPVFEGRVCQSADRPDAPTSVLVNRLLAERLWPGESPVGRRVRAVDGQVTAVIIGVVGNTRPQMLTQPVAPQIYGCLSQNPGIFASIAIKTTAEPMRLARSVQETIWSIDRDQPMWKIRTADSLLSGSVQRERFVMLMMTFAAALALLLAGVGTYSVLAYSVQRRAREVGVRMALGATRGSIARLVIGQTALLTLIGIGLGLAGAVALSRAVASQLYEVSPRDPFIFVTTAVLLAAVALAAAWVPTRRATGVDPVTALRQE